MRTHTSALLAAALLAATTTPAVSMARTPEAEATELDEVIVLARRSGAPMWTVTRGDSSLIWSARSPAFPGT